ncbi:hypothetical protein [Aurantibacter sp.]|uniref:hypothetical protein n=1 Tax=Aurantibacter sp. TaxID=2807103 RepID=UPI0035C8388F
MNKKQLKGKIYKLADGVPLKLDRMTINLLDSNKLLVTSWINTIDFKSITKDLVNKELIELKALFSELMSSFNEFDIILTSNNLSIEYHIAFDDSGKAGIGLCSELDGKINWYI